MTLETVLIVDTETTGLTPVDGSRVIEYGAVLFSVPTVSVISCWSELVHLPGDDSNAAESTNRIPSAALALSQALEHEHVLVSLFKLASRADALVAHNAVFDRTFVEHACGGPLRGASGEPLPWICTLEDVDWPRPSSSMSLVAIALAHDVGVVQAHRALADCTLIARLFERVHELSPGCLPALLDKALRPKAVFQAVVRYDERHLAKEQRFRWEPESKRWLRRMAVEDAAALPFRVKDVTAVVEGVKMTSERVGWWVEGPPPARTVGYWWSACSCGAQWPATQTVAECTKCLVRGFAPKAKETT